MVRRYLGGFGLMCALMACDDMPQSAAKQEARQTEQLAQQAAVTVGMPAIMHFTEKRQLKMIYELRDTANLVTYTYTIDIQGRRHKVCPSTSIGFGVPHSTQYTSPTRHVFDKSGGYEQPQPEPNGLYMPSSADATWVMCLNPQTKELAPTYVEPHVVVYLFEMPSVD